MPAVVPCAQNTRLNQQIDEWSVVTMPVIYPDGSSVCLAVAMQGDRCIVSDMGGAFDSADMMGAGRRFKPDATRVAEYYHIKLVKLDHDLAFVADVPIDSVRGAMIAVANASAEAARATYLPPRSPGK